VVISIVSFQHYYFLEGAQELVGTFKGMPTRKSLKTNDLVPLFYTMAEVLKRQSC